MLYQWLIRLAHQCICERAVKMTAIGSFDSASYRLARRHQRREESDRTRWRQRANHTSSQLKLTPVNICVKLAIDWPIRAPFQASKNDTPIAQWRLERRQWEVIEIHSIRQTINGSEKRFFNPLITDARSACWSFIKHRLVPDIDQTIRNRFDGCLRLDSFSPPISLLSIRLIAFLSLSILFWSFSS